MSSIVTKKRLMKQLGTPRDVWYDPIKPTVHQTVIDLCLSFKKALSVQHYSSSAPEPVAALLDSTASPIADTQIKVEVQAVACPSVNRSNTSEKVSFTSKGAM